VCLDNPWCHVLRTINWKEGSIVTDWTDWTFDDFLEHCLPPTSALSELYELEIAGGISPETREWLAWVQEAREWLIGNGGEQ
jgi:hypothetical protein